MSNAYDQTFITEPAPKDLSVSLTLAARLKSPARGWRESRARLWGLRGGGEEAPAAPGGSGFPRRLLSSAPAASPSESASRRRGRGAAGSPGALTESASPEFPAAIDLATLRPQRRLGPPFLLALWPPLRVRESAWWRSLPETGNSTHALLHPGPLQRSDTFLARIWGYPEPCRPGCAFEPHSSLGRGVVCKKKKSWRCGSRPHFFPPPDARRTRLIAQFLRWNCRVTRTKAKNASQVSPAQKGAAGCVALIPGAL